MHPYVILLLCGAALSTVLFARQLRKHHLPGKLALTALFFSALLGFVLGKVVYVLSLASRMFPRYGANAFLRMAFAEFSFVGAAMGAVLGVVLAGRIHRARTLPVLDAFAPAGALMVAIARGGEYFLNMLGVGNYLENESLYFFPLAVQNEWGEYFLAVFMMSAAFALLILLLSLLLGKRLQNVPGLLFEMVLFHLALSQILCENLRVQYMQWGFVRTEQLYCAVVCLLVLVRACCAYGGKGQSAKPVSLLGRLWPVLALLLCAGVIILIQFALDGKIQLEATYCYLLLVVTLLVMSALGIYAAGRRLR